MFGALHEAFYPTHFLPPVSLCRWMPPHTDTLLMTYAFAIVVFLFSFFVTPFTHAQERPKSSSTTRLPAGQYSLYGAGPLFATSIMGPAERPRWVYGVRGSYRPKAWVFTGLDITYWPRGIIRDTNLRQVYNTMIETKTWSHIVFGRGGDVAKIHIGAGLSFVRSNTTTNFVSGSVVKEAGHHIGVHGKVGVSFVVFKGPLLWFEADTGSLFAGAASSRYTIYSGKMGVSFLF